MKQNSLRWTLSPCVLHRTGCSLSPPLLHSVTSAKSSFSPQSFEDLVQPPPKFLHSRFSHFQTNSRSLYSRLHIPQLPPTLHQCRKLLHYHNLAVGGSPVFFSLFSSLIRADVDIWRGREYQRGLPSSLHKTREKPVPRPADLRNQISFTSPGPSLLQPHRDSVVDVFPATFQWGRH